MSEDVKQRISTAHKGKKHSPETKKKISKSNKDIAKSDEHKLALSMATTKKPFALVNRLTGEEWRGYNLAAFAKANGLTQPLLSLVLHGKRRHHKGWYAASNTSRD